uniref:CSON001125 protein n=1 Tax=Culicoides sonorensis TaxID=179676 RepID=A0A336MFY3_CULSO
MLISCQSVLNFSKKSNFLALMFHSSKFTDTIKNNQLKPFNEIPGPKRYGFLGPLNDALTTGDPKNLHKMIHKMHELYGPIFKIKLGKIDSIFTSSCENMRAIFLYEGKHPKHPVPPAWAYFNKKYNCKRGLFFMDDNEWLHYRKMLNPLLLQDFNQYKAPIEMACDKFIREIMIKSDAAAKREDKNLRDTEFIELIDLEARLYRWSIDVVLSVMLDTSSDKIIPNTLIEEFSKVVHKIFDFSSHLQSIPPQLADFFQINAWKNFVSVVNESLKLGNEITENAIANCPRNARGLLNQLKDKQFNDDQIKRLFIDLIIAAGDTTSFATQWMLYLVAKNEDAQTRIRKNLVNDLEMETDLIKGAVREALRLYPPATFIGRFMQDDGNLNDFQIPKGTLALLSLYTAGRDPNHFSSPNDFVPERWLRNDNSSQNEICKPQASLPYAIGVRSCIGRKIANYQMHTLLTKLLLKYEMKLLNCNEIDSTMKMVITPAESIRIGLKSR